CPGQGRAESEGLGAAIVAFVARWTGSSRGEAAGRVAGKRRVAKWGARADRTRSELFSGSSRASALSGDGASGRASGQRCSGIVGQTVAASLARLRPDLEPGRPHPSTSPLRAPQKPRRITPLELKSYRQLRDAPPRILESGGR